MIGALFSVLIILLLIFVALAMAIIPERLEACESLLKCVARGAVMMLFGVSPLIQPEDVDARSGLPLDPHMMNIDQVSSIEMSGSVSWGWVSLNMVTYAVLVVLLHTLVSGILFNEFANQTDAAEALARDNREVCLVCSLRREAFEQSAADSNHSGGGVNQQEFAWRRHVKVEHNPLEYVALAITLRVRHADVNSASSMTTQERNVLERFLTRDASVIPLEACSSLTSAHYQFSSTSATSTQIHQLESRVEDIAATIREHGSRTQGVENLVRDIQVQLTQLQESLAISTTSSILAAPELRANNDEDK